ncbi:MAG: hypothetical protein QM773_21185 [Hyphomonadaceae bacterium]
MHTTIGADPEHAVRTEMKIADASALVERLHNLSFFNVKTDRRSLPVEHSRIHGEAHVGRLFTQSRSQPGEAPISLSGSVANNQPQVMIVRIESADREACFLERSAHAGGIGRLRPHCRRDQQEQCGNQAGAN